MALTEKKSYDFIEGKSVSKKRAEKGWGGKAKTIEKEKDVSKESFTISACDERKKGKIGKLTVRSSLHRLKGVKVKKNIRYRRKGHRDKMHLQHVAGKCSKYNDRLNP